MRNTSPRDLVPLDTARLYAELRAAGFDAPTALRGLNYVLGVVAPRPRATPT